MLSAFLTFALLALCRCLIVTVDDNIKHDFLFCIHLAASSLIALII